MWTVELYLVHWKRLRHDPLERVSQAESVEGKEILSIYET